jgi:hypothetical protein
MCGGQLFRFVLNRCLAGTLVFRALDEAPREKFGPLLYEYHLADFRIVLSRIFEANNIESIEIDSA